MKSTFLKLFLICVIATPVFYIVNSFADQGLVKDTVKGITKDTVKDAAKENTDKKQIKIPEYAHVFSTESTFEDAKDDLLEAIASNGLVISYTSHAKTMLDNTAAVSSVTKSVYENAEILLFCKADLSHKLVAGNPHNIVLCPYSIAIYVLVDEPETVYLSFPKPLASDEEIKALTKPIEELLINIIEEVIWYLVSVILYSITEVNVFY